MTRIEELTLRLVDGIASDQEKMELAGLLSADAAARAEFQALIEIETALRNATPADVTDETMERLKQALAEHTAAQVMAVIQNPGGFVPADNAAQSEIDAAGLAGPARPVWFGGPARWMGLAAALTLVVAGSWWWFKEANAGERFMGEAHGLVRITRGGKILVAPARFKVLPGDQVKTDRNAAAILEVPGEQTRITLGDRSELAFVSAQAGRQWRLIAGEVHAKVERQVADNPMRFHTRHATATVIGTEFSIRADDERTRLDVRNGLVRLAGSGARNFDVLAGEYATVSATEEPDVKPFLRETALWPFAVESPWNRPLTDQASFSPVRSGVIERKGFRSAVAALSVNLESVDAPLRKIIVAGQSIGEFRVREDAALVSPVWPALFLSSDHQRTYELLNPERRSNGDLVAEAGQRMDLQGFGFAAMGSGVSRFSAPFSGGLIRRSELSIGIRHALAAALKESAFNFKTPDGTGCVWPLNPISPIEAGVGNPSGNLHPGTLLALPPAVNVASLSLDAAGSEIAHALQDYGVYLVQAGNQPFTLFVEEGAVPPRLNIEDALNKLVPLLEVVANNAPSPEVRGTPRRPPAPFFLGPGPN